ncbi:DNA repair protein RecO [Daejeonella lutea]|uniref:DNA repair protein RecO n=1 Tax=Daejeonella lutea TaxID=572036 RepID=A0A1T5CYN8_9SPHI|nr:DNA repair protein RecO [Daejeonella lutea]SKB64509.1 DNA replication and repair protein RecO [Daejeonella lutea]
MLYKTRGIVFKVTDYSETSVVVQIFTEKFGLQSYLINGVKKPKAKIRLNSLQPLHLLEMIVYHKTTGTIQRVSELRHQPVFQSIPYDIIKSSITMFLNEVLYKSLRQHEPDEILFEFLFHAIEILDSLNAGLANFHLYFLLRLTRFLGFYPDKTLASPSAWFDLKDGHYSKTQPPHSYIIEPPLTAIWINILNCNFDNLQSLQISPAERKALLEKILTYYQLHVEGFGQVKAHEVLEEVLG